MSNGKEQLNVGGVKVEITPTAQVSSTATKEVVVTDSDGRSITLRKPGVLLQYRIVEALGASAMNQAYMSMVLPLIYISAIDDSPVAFPATKGEVEALIKRLDEHGVEAVMLGVQENFGGASNADQDKAALKNS